MIVLDVWREYSWWKWLVEHDRVNVVRSAGFPFTCRLPLFTALLRIPPHSAGSEVNQVSFYWEVSNPVVWIRGVVTYMTFIICLAFNGPRSRSQNAEFAKSIPRFGSERGPLVMPKARSIARFLLTRLLIAVIRRQNSTRSKLKRSSMSSNLKELRNSILTAINIKILNLFFIYNMYLISKW